MFQSSSFNQDISSWDVSNVVNMSNMFSRSSFNQDISNWDSDVKDMSWMFYENYYFNQNISNRMYQMLKVWSMFLVLLLSLIRMAGNWMLNLSRLIIDDGLIQFLNNVSILP
ncbi:MAG: BspA family leucine-rich repeat surface protein [Saprospiraceae bacterium]